MVIPSSYQHPNLAQISEFAYRISDINLFLSVITWPTIGLALFGMAYFGKSTGIFDDIQLSVASVYSVLYQIQVL